MEALYMHLFKKLKQKPMTLSCFNLLVAIWLACALNMSFFQKAVEYSGLTGIYAIWWLFSIVVVLICYYFIILQLVAWSWTKKIVALCMIIIGGSTAYFINSMGIMITPEQIQNMAQTDHKEVTNIISRDFLINFLLLVVIPSTFIFFISVKKNTLLKQVTTKILSILGALLIAGGLIYVNYVDFSSLFRGHRELRFMLSPQSGFSSSLSYYKKLSYKPLPLVLYGQDATMHVQQPPKLMVLVVGETARAQSFSLNGYARNTNPELSKLPDLINFKQASSCGTATAVSVPCMFSGMPRVDYDSQLASHREGLLDIAQRAGYKVTWIDNNSGCKGACDRVGQYKIPQDIQKQYCDGREYCSDGVLVASLQRYMQSIPQADQTPQLIVLHQMGSHGPAYYDRTLPEFTPFKPTCNTTTIQSCDHQSLINSYDNSIVYTDHVLSQVVTQLHNTTKYQTGFWYLSDHGESTGENGLYLHGTPYAFAPSQQTHIPMMMWFSPSWNKQQIQCLAGQTNKQVGQDNLFPTLLSLLDVKTQVIDSKLNMLSQCSQTIQ